YLPRTIEYVVESGPVVPTLLMFLPAAEAGVRDLVFRVVAGSDRLPVAGWPLSVNGREFGVTNLAGQVHWSRKVVEGQVLVVEVTTPDGAVFQFQRRVPEPGKDTLELVIETDDPDRR
ncbi:hypothetical protein JW905_00100, partial [bacterium]|nr:hypothetical protein [candidate division CSSED10-310 bacterium]